MRVMADSDNYGLAHLLFWGAAYACAAPHGASHAYGTRGGAIGKADTRRPR